MQEGWISVHRSLLDHEIWTKEPFTRGQAWVDLLLLANHKEGWILVRGVKIDIKRGQVGWSEERLSSRWKWSRTKVRNFLNLLEKEQQIIQQKNNVSLLITITNYDKYQKKEQQKEPQKNSRKTAKEQQKDTNNNVNNENNVNKEKIVDFPFEEIWEKYPDKDGRKDALTHFKATVKTHEDWAAINQALDNYLAHLKANVWKRPKNGKTWFNNWRDWVNWVEPGAAPKIPKPTGKPPCAKCGSTDYTAFVDDTCMDCRQGRTKIATAT